MFSCNYNGWADVPEEEREGIDVFEARRPPNPPVFLAAPLDGPMALIAVPTHRPARSTIRKAA